MGYAAELPVARLPVRRACREFLAVRALFRLGWLNNEAPNRVIIARCWLRR